MKILRSVLAIMVLGAVAVSLGCAKKATEPVVTPPAATTVALPAAQQASAASQVSGNVSSNISSVEDMASGLNNGTFSPKKGIKTPPAGWTLNPTNGWYYLTSSGEMDSAKVKFSPVDIWAQNPWPKPGQIEYYYYFHYDEIDTSAGGMSSYVKGQMHGLAKHTGGITDTNGTLVDGNWGYNVAVNLVGNSLNLDLSFMWSCIFDNVSTVNHGKHFTYTCSWPYISAGATGVVVTRTDLTGEMKLDAAGYGILGTAGDGYAGWCATNGTTFIRYYSDAGGRYYTLLCDSPAWGTHHTW